LEKLAVQMFNGSTLQTSHDVEDVAAKRIGCIQNEFKTAFAAFVVEKTSSSHMRNIEAGRTPAQESLVKAVEKLIVEKAGPLISSWLEESEVKEVVDAVLLDAESTADKIGQLDAKAADERLDAEFAELVDLVDSVVDANS
jgi:hypothetical protein